jgi:hypothetical protein
MKIINEILIEKAKKGLDIENAIKRTVEKIKAIRDENNLNTIKEVNELIDKINNSPKDNLEELVDNTSLAYQNIIDLVKYFSDNKLETAEGDKRRAEAQTQKWTNEFGTDFTKAKNTKDTTNNTLQQWQDNFGDDPTKAKTDYDNVLKAKTTTEGELDTAKKDHKK